VALYFGLHEQIIELIRAPILRITGEDPTVTTTQALATPRVLAGTILFVLIVAVWWPQIKADPRYHAPILITYILAMADAAYGILANHTSEWLTWLTSGQITGYSPTFVAILAAIAMEMVLSRFLSGRWPHLASAYISGISVGILVKSNALWPFVLCALISITSKYVLRVGGRHLWNPSNFGVTIMLLLAADHVASLSVESGNEFLPLVLVWALGSLILYRLGRLHIPLTFLAAFIPLCFLRYAVSGNGWAEFGPLTWPMFQLYIFFMLTDPKTTTRTVTRQCVVVVLVAIVDTILRLGFRDQHALYHALFIVAPITNYLEIVYEGRKKATTT
jgi:hypothetical protein